MKKVWTIQYIVEKTTAQSKYNNYLIHRGKMIILQGRSWAEILLPKCSAIMRQISVCHLIGSNEENTESFL